MSVGLENRTITNSFERTPEQRINGYVLDILKVIDDPQACKDKEYGTYSPLNIAYLQATYDPEGHVADEITKRITELTGFPESECMVADAPGVETISTRSAVVTSLSSGNTLFKDTYFSSDGEIWGYQFWIDSSAHVA